MRFGDDYTLDPILIIGQGPKGKGIFSDTTYADLPVTDDTPATPIKGSRLVFLALLAAGAYLAVKS